MATNDPLVTDIIQRVNGIVKLMCLELNKKMSKLCHACAVFEQHKFRHFLFTAVATRNNTLLKSLMFVRRCSSLVELLCLYFYLTRAMFPAPNFEKCPQKKPAAKPITAR